MGEHRTLSFYLNDLRSLDDATFATRHGEAFLIHEGPIEAMHAPERKWQATTMMPAMGGPGPDGLLDVYAVFPIVRTGRSTLGWGISVGRTENNDIVLPDASVSAFHAYFEVPEPGRYLIQDAGSSNGTKLGELVVPTQADGDALLVKPGDKVHFAAVTTTFQTVLGLRKLTMGLAGG